MAGAGSSALGGRVVVTGAGGFIGAALCAAFAAEGRAHTPWVRGDDIDAAVSGASAIVHAAGRAHLEGAAPDARARMTRDNEALTEAFARAAQRAGIARFVLVGSVKAGVSAHDGPAGDDFYGQSKLRAEQVLLRHVPTATILRLPMVYGANARGNFRALVDAVAERRWLPLAAIDNRRRLLSIGNLVGAVRAVLDASHGTAGVHCAGDANAVSTPQLVRAIAAALGVEPRLSRMPVGLLRLGGALCGRSSEIERVTQSLDFDIGPLTAATGWRPAPFHVAPEDVGRTVGQTTHR
jgi:nucleoside-diphosphate-sugar epimerase